MKFLTVTLILAALTLSFIPPLELMDFDQVQILGLSGSLFAVFLSSLLSTVAIVPIYYSYLKPVSEELDKQA